jgi:serine protease Do
MTGWKRLLVCVALAVPAAGIAAEPGRAEVRESSGVLRQLNVALSQLADRVSPAVVQIVVSGYGLAATEDGRAAAAVIARQRVVGSGVIVDPTGYILTNAHVVQGAERILVVPPLRRAGWPGDQNLYKRPNYRAHLIGMHAESDLAVLKIDAVGLPALTLRGAPSVMQGEVVFAIGAPQGLASTMTMGIVSSARRQLDRDSPFLFIQTDAPINPGNSGGPLVNADGEVVGINTFILSGSGGSEGLGFAVPGHVARFVYDGLRKRGYVRRLEVGISAQGITPELASGLGLPRDSGVIVSDVDPRGPAGQAGLRRGDVLDAVDGRRIEILPDLTAALYRASAPRLEVRVFRDREPLDLHVQALARDPALDDVADLANPDKHLVGRLGVIALDVDQAVQQKLHLREPSGVVVVARTLEGPSASSALLPGARSTTAAAETPWCCRSSETGNSTTSSSTSSNLPGVRSGLEDAGEAKNRTSRARGYRGNRGAAQRRPAAVQQRNEYPGARADRGTCEHVSEVMRFGDHPQRSRRRGEHARAGP